MKTSSKKIKETLVRLDELQASHIDAFSTQTIPNLEEQMAQRKKGFSDLKKYIETFLSETNIKEMQDVKEQILSLMYQNQTLTSKVQGHKRGLENSMKKITKGRQAIHAYGSVPSQANQPKVINFRK